MPIALAIDVNKIPLGPFDTRLWWLLIGLCVALLLTLQAVETAVEGAWPSDRRPSRFLPRARTVQASWAWVALLIIPGGLLAIAYLASRPLRRSSGGKRIPYGIAIAAGTLAVMALSRGYLQDHSRPLPPIKIIRPSA